MAIYKVNLNRPTALIAFLGEIALMGEKRVAIGPDYASCFWKMYNAAKQIPEVTDAMWKAHIGNTASDWNLHMDQNPGLEFKASFPKGKPWKDRDGQWWFYFND